MDNWPWSILNRYCQDPTQRAWVSDQLRIAPIPTGQSPEDWLLARSMVAEGSTDAEAWAQVAALRQNRQSSNQSQNQNEIFNNNDNNVFHQQTPLTFQNNVQPNGFYNDHLGSVFEQPTIGNPPYGFVSLQQVAPQNTQPRNIGSVPILSSNQPQIPTQVLPSHLSNLTQQQLQQLFMQHQRQLALANSGSSPSISPHLLHQQTRPQQPQLQPQSQAQLYAGQSQTHPQPQQPFTIDLTGSSSPPESSTKPEPQDATSGTFPLSRTNSPLMLIPPGSSRTPSPSAFHQLSVQPGPSRKRSLVPVPQQENSKAAKKVKSSSSSIDPPVKLDNDQLLPDEKPKAAATAPSEPITMKDIRPFLTPEALKLPKPSGLFKNLRKREIKGKDTTLPPLFQPTPKETLEIVTAIRDHASQQYLRVMADDYRYCAVFATWLYKATKNIEKWESTIVPILQVLVKTDMDTDDIEDTDIRERAQTVADLAIRKNLASKDAIQSAFRRYDSYIENVLKPKYKKIKAEEEGPDNKKRKIEEDTKSKVEAGSSKQISSKVSAPTSSINGSKAPVKPASSLNPSGPSKPNGKSATDMSFFGTNPSSSSTKPKPKLPDIKKKPPQPPPQTAAPAISSNLLQSTLQRLSGTAPSSASNVPSTKPSDPANQTPLGLINEIRKEEAKPRYNAKGKLIRNVRFKDDVKPEEGGGSLEQVKEFKQEAKEFERFDWEHDDDIHGQSAHQLDIAEGAALASARGHATIDWYEPSPYTDPVDPIETEEVKAQTERERGILAKFHPPGIPIPDPSEDQVRIVAHDAETRIMDPMDASDQILQYQSRGQYRAPSTSTILPHQQNNTVSDLLKGLQNVIPPVQPQHRQQQHNAYGSDSSAYPYDSYGHQQSNHPQTSWGHQNWGGAQNDYSRGYDNHHNSRDMRPVDRDPNVPICKFWSRGDCSHGDRCRHRHV